MKKKHLKNRLLPSSTRNLNISLTAAGTPSSNGAFSCSIQDFTRILLHVEHPKSSLPPSPPQSQLSGFNNQSAKQSPSEVAFANFRSYLAERKLSELEVAGRLKCIPVICQKFFADDLAARNIHHISFAWNQSPSSPYNDWLSSLVLKHWTFAKNNNLLNQYHFSPTDDTPETAQRVIFRWIHGRQREFRLSARAPDWCQAQAVRELKSKRKALISKNQVDTCVALSLPAKICQIFMDPVCTSDTEEDGHGNLLRTHLSWQSQEFTNFSHNLDVATIERLHKEKGAQYVQRNKLLELCRHDTITTSVKPPVPVGLPQNCYDPIYLQSRQNFAKTLLQIQDRALEFPSV